MYPFSIILSVAIALNTPLFLLSQMKTDVREGRIEEAIQIAQTLKEKDFKGDTRHTFFAYKTMAFHQIGDKKNAEMAIKEFRQSFGVASEREKALIFLIEDDMGRWSKDKLDSVVRKMKRVEDRLQNSKGGPITQSVQREIVSDLDRLIKEKEDAKAKASGEGDGSGDEDAEKPDSKKPGVQGLKESKIAGGAGKGNVDEKKLTGLAQQWGKLPEKSRAAAMQDLTRDMPAKHVELIRQYFLKLSRDSGDK